ncbi:right-handed parallel beta-helix repeat-containing protein [Actinomadura macrotermitis]|uniref:Right handed beta helix domain-containing protein n=1 Tax=Actinomadura macrotermitis TaxID=2585200 RepID=A0A7K0BSJ4_9ACTN|nr:right-handed parallel beta-helix repeat-containing protein [Actinomadura macrotermitis]MQY04006.1 hypothetical protein [Actinomadura macrotermitis]
MSHGSRRALIVKALALPAAVGAGVLGWQFPGDGPRPRPAAEASAGPAGAEEVGTTGYAVPRDAVVVSPQGDDGADGTLARPLRTVAKAVAAAGDKGTVVLRGGVYHETVTIPAGKRLTVQAYPREAVWFDGSSPVRRWAARDGAWESDGWTARFDASPTYTAGARPSADPEFQFVSPQHPMASHPDQLWVDGAAQRQVGSRAEVKGGAFYVDEQAGRLVMGSDPRGHDVRASTLGEAVTVRGAGSVLRGFGVRRYATALPQLGTVKIAAAGVGVENVAVTESATTGLSVLAGGARLTKVTASRNGLLGVHGNYADDLRLSAVRADGNNTEHFKYAPVSGGVKITRSRKVTIEHSVAADNFGKGFWLDESVRDIALVADKAVRNADHGFVLELSARAVVAGNVARGNDGAGMKVNDTSDVQIWNNTVAGNERGLWIVQDRRVKGAPGTPGGDPRYKGADPEMTWRAEKVTVGNNVFGAGRPGARCALCVEDATGGGAAGMGLVIDGNAYSGGRGTPILWAGRGGTPTGYPGPERFREGTGQERSGRPRPLPAPIAALVKRPPGTLHQGAWIS